MSRPRVLIASADHEFRELVEKECGQRCFEAVVIESTEEVHKALESLLPELLIVDLDDALRDGVSLLRALAERSCKVPMVLVSRCDSQTLAAAERVGEERGLSVSGTLHKPVDSNQLARVLLATLRPGQRVIGGDDIRAAIENDEFDLHYQPLIDIADGAVHGCEVLLRWNHPTYGSIEPSKVIPVAEESGLISPLTDWILERSLRQYASWARQGWNFRIAINVEADVLRDFGFADRVAKIVDDSGVRPDRVILEVTESQTITEEVQVLETLTRLRLTGIELAIDDFGTGHSSLGRLHQLPFSELKIDKSFVLDAEHNPQAEIIVRTIAQLGRNLGMVVVAEGVQTRELMELVRNLECDIAQGFFISRGLPADEFTRWLYRWGVTNSVMGHELGEVPGSSSPPLGEWLDPLGLPQTELLDVEDSTPSESAEVEAQTVETLDPTTPMDQASLLRVRRKA